jgi:glycosyltransferase involved in cell wall biosynthesis
MRYVPSLAPRWIPDGDVVVATAWSTAYAAAAAPVRCGIGHYLIQSDESLWDPNVELARQSWNLPLRKAVIARWLLDVAASRVSADVKHIPLAIDHGLFNVRQEIRGRRPHVAMLASTNPIKRTALGIDVLAAVRESVPELRVSIFGSPPTTLELPDWMDRLGVLSQAELSGLFNETSTYLCTSKVEGWHLPPAEAMACGNALVSTDIGGVRDYARHGDTSWLAPVDDRDALATGLVRVLTDGDLRFGLAVRGSQEVGGYTWERTIAAFEGWLRDR